MRNTLFRVIVLIGLARPANAQQPTTPPKPPATKADSVAQALADSLALMRALDQLAPPRTSAAPSTGGSQGTTNPRMLPDFSAVGDLLADLSPKRSTQSDNSRFAIREVELAVQSVVDPYFRGDIFLGISDAEGISIEQAFLTTSALPNGLQSQLGRFLMPFGKQNTTHRHDLHTIEYPYVLQRFLSDDGLKGTGVSLSRVFAPFGFYQEVILTATDRFGDPVDSLVLTEPVNRGLDGLGFSARVRNYWDLSQNANLELSASAITGKRPQPMATPYLTTDYVTASGVAARQSVFGVDLTYRWKPLQQGLYTSFLFQAEWMQQTNERSPVLPDAAPTPAAAPLLRNYAGPTRDYSGGYAFARWQLSQRLYVGGRYDHVQDPTAGGALLTAGSAVLEWFPSEFSKLEASYERLNRPGSLGVDRLLFQATFAVGPHKPHPF